MNRNGPIILIEDDHDDVEIIRAAIEPLTLQNRLETFSSGTGVVNYLSDENVHPLMVISDVNLPGQHGVDLYMQVLSKPAFRQKQIPYVFLSTSPDHAKRAAEVSKCGYFVKPRDYFAYINLIQRIVLYWKHAEVR